MSDHADGADRAHAHADAPPSPEESLRLIRQQQSAVESLMQRSLLLYYLPWGLTWLIGFGMFVLRDGIGESGPYVSMPYGVPLAVLFILMGAALAITVVAGARESTRIGGDSTARGITYGLSWVLAFGTIMPIVAHFAELLARDERAMLFAAVPVGLTGTLYVAGAAVWRSRSMFVLGGWILVVNMAGVLAGTGWHSLVIAVAGGGGLILAGVAARLGWWRDAA